MLKLKPILYVYTVQNFLKQRSSLYSDTYTYNLTSLVTLNIYVKFPVA